VTATVTGYGPVAACQAGCGLVARRGRLTADSVRQAARRHARLTGHVVEVESRQVQRFQPGGAPAPLMLVQAEGARLTPRETQVAALIAEGLSNREIAIKLVVSLRTVDAHAEHIRRKLGVPSRLQVALWYEDEVASAAAPGR
jgi:DNA-binding NarL/FixJ family response regulator